MDKLKMKQPFTLSVKGCFLLQYFFRTANDFCSYPLYRCKYF